MRFSTKSITDAIILNTQAYMRSIDEIAEQVQKQQDQVETVIQQNKGNWTPQYIDQYRAEHSVSKSVIGQRMQKKRDAAFPRMMLLLDQLHQWVDTVFSGMPKQEFISTLNALKMMGVKLSRYELEVLDSRVGCYTERKLINALYDENGIKPPVTVPDIESIMKEVNTIENRAKTALRFYAGEDQRLFYAIDQSESMTPVSVLSTMTIGKTATDQKRYDELAEKIDSAANIRELTQEENKQVMEVIKSGVTDSALQLAIDSSDYSVKNLIRLSDFGDRVKVIA